MRIVPFVRIRAVVVDEIESVGISISNEPSRKKVGARRRERNRPNSPYLDKPATGSKSSPIGLPRADQIYAIKKGNCAASERYPLLTFVPFPDISTSSPRYDVFRTL